MHHTYDHVLFISMDTCRADHLGCYGYARNTTPILLKFSEENISCTKAFASSVPTLPSHASVFTSLYQGVHGAEVTTSTPIPDQIPTLADILRRKGYITAAFHNGAQLSEIWNVFKGFDIVNFASSQSIKESAELYCSFIQTHKDTKTFGFVHGLDLHFPFYKPDLFSSELKVDKAQFITQINTLEHQTTDHEIKTQFAALYDDSLAFFDKYIGTIFDTLKNAGIYDKTIIVIFGDHGEEMGERSLMAAHHKNLFEELIHVPLIMRIPGLAPTVIKTHVRLVDIMPTVLAALGFEEKILMQGQNLLPILRGEKGVDLPVFTEYINCTSSAITIRTSFFQLICERETTFFARARKQYALICARAAQEQTPVRRCVVVIKMILNRFFARSPFDTMTFCNFRKSPTPLPITFESKPFVRRNVKRLLELIHDQQQANKLVKKKMIQGRPKKVTIHDDMKKRLEELGYL